MFVKKNPINYFQEPLILYQHSINFFLVLVRHTKS